MISIAMNNIEFVQKRFDRYGNEVNCVWQDE